MFALNIVRTIQVQFPFFYLHFVSVFGNDYPNLLIRPSGVGLFNMLVIVSYQEQETSGGKRREGDRDRRNWNYFHFWLQISIDIKIFSDSKKTHSSEFLIKSSFRM